MVLEYIEKYREEIKKCIENLKHKETFYKQIPNLLTFSRAVGAPIISVLFFTGNIVGGLISTVLLFLTDLFDGRLARKLGVTSKFGADLDAVCDKIMFLGFVLPLIVGNPVLIVNFLLEGVIAYVNVLGRMKGLDTKTVFAGKIKTCFLSATLVVGYLVKFFGFSPILLKILASMTIGSQAITVNNYIEEYKKMKAMKEFEKIFKDVENELKESEELEQSVSLVDDLRKEREFYLGMKEPDKKIESNKRVRRIENEKKSNN